MTFSRILPDTHPSLNPPKAGNTSSQAMSSSLLPNIDTVALSVLLEASDRDLYLEGEVRSFTRAGGIRFY